MLKSSWRLSLAMLLFAVLAPAQQSSAGNWARVSALAPGAEVRIILTSGRTLRGFLQAVMPDSLAINATTSQETLMRPDIKRVQLRREGHRGRNTLIGLAIGAGGGLAIGAAADRNSGNWLPNLGKEVLTPLGAILGTIVGVAIPTGGWREVYRGS